MTTRFLQLHFLTSYPSALLNRDDAGFAKRIPFGGASRTRISSQCLKKHWRSFKGEHALAELNLEPSIRSRYTFERYLYEPLVKEGVGQELAAAVTSAIMGAALGKNEKKAAKASEDEKKKGKEPKASKAATSEKAAAPSAPDLMTAQLTVLGRPEVDYLLSIAREICKDKPELKKAQDAIKAKLDKEARTNLEQLKRASGLDAALFGRMVTSDILATGDAALHVAHAFTVHAEASETDYFTAVDEIAGRDGEEQLGSAHVNSSELTSGLFYGYVVVDVPLLISNLEGTRDWAKADKKLAAKVVEHMVHLIATVSPGAKLGSTAPHSWAHMVLAETGNSQPRTLANAFLKPVREQPDLLANTFDALGGHVADFDRMYGRKFDRRIAAVGPSGALCKALEIEKPVGLDDLAKWAAGKVLEA